MKRLIRMYQDLRLFMIVTMVACCAVDLMDILANGSTWFNWAGFVLGIAFLMFLSVHYPRNPRALLWLDAGVLQAGDTVDVDDGSVGHVKRLTNGRLVIEINHDM